MNNKGQVTVFIIIGIVLLLSIGLVLYVTQEAAIQPIKRTVTIPQGGQEIFNYVSKCVGDIGEEGLVLLGQQGGYINIPRAITRDPNAFVKVDPLGIVKTPFWYYEGEDRTPELEYMMRELALYIKNNLPDCTRNFEVFSDRFSVKPVGDILPIVEFTDTQVITTVSWPLEITAPGKIIRVDEFIYDHTVPIKPMYELADKIMKFENKNGWFENLTIDLMSANEDIPMSGMEFECGTKKWYLQEVKKELKNTLYYNLPYVRVDNTDYPAPLNPLRDYEKLRKDASKIRGKLEAGKEPNWPKDAPEDTYYMNRMRFNPGAQPSDFKVAFVHQQNWPLFMNAQPSQGQVLSSSFGRGPSKYLKFLCINQYHFAYDVIYPLKTLIKDNSAFDGRGYSFQFGFPVVIEDNEEKRAFFGLKRFIVPDLGGDFCQEFGVDTIDVRVTGFVENSPVAEELEGANVTYRCLTQECVLGSTGGDGSGSTRLYSYLPEGCSKGILQANKKGYLPAQTQIAGPKAEIFMDKLLMLNYTIKIHPYYEEVGQNPMAAKNTQWLEGQEYTKFSPTTSATVYLTLRDSEYDQYLLYPPDGEKFGAKNLAKEIGTQQVGFVHGTRQYDLDIMLFRGDTPVGGYSAKNITISASELSGATKVEFHAIEYRPLPVEDYQQAGMFVFLFERGQYGNQPYWEYLRPTFT